MLVARALVRFTEFEFGSESESEFVSESESEAESSSSSRICITSWARRRTVSLYEGISEDFKRELGKLSMEVQKKSFYFYFFLPTLM